MKVLSLFDGISCGRVALERAGIKVSRYVASEIDKYAIGISMANWKDIERKGAAQDLNFEEGEFDLLIGGSPCQGLSRGNSQRLNLQDERSALFFEYLRIKKQVKPKWFLLENVVCDKQTEEIISEEMGTKPILINSSLLSAQNRERLYWTNIPFEMPKDLEITIQKALNDQFIYPAAMRGRYITGGKTAQFIERRKNNKSNCLTTVDKDNVIIKTAIEEKTLASELDYRYLSIAEYELLQTLPIGYTNSVSAVKGKKAIGNGWTVDVIAHILSYIPK